MECLGWLQKKAAGLEWVAKLEIDRAQSGNQMQKIKLQKGPKWKRLCPSRWLRSNSKSFKKRAWEKVQGESLSTSKNKSVTSHSQRGGVPQANNSSVNNGLKSMEFCQDLKKNMAPLGRLLEVEAQKWSSSMPTP